MGGGGGARASRFTPIQPSDFSRLWSIFTSVQKGTECCIKLRRHPTGLPPSTSGHHGHTCIKQWHSLVLQSVCFGIEVSLSQRTGAVPCSQMSVAICERSCGDPGWALAPDFNCSSHEEWTVMYCWKDWQYQGIVIDRHKLHEQFARTIVEGSRNHRLSTSDGKWQFRIECANS